MRIRGTLVDALFVRRLNRFVALVEMDGQVEPAHLPNSGRMRELLYPGASVLVAERAGPRRTHLDLLMARSGPLLVSLDARLPSALLEEALWGGLLPELGGFSSLEREVRIGASRLDLRADGPAGPLLIETKSVTLVQEGVALFPDAPTARGTRHVEELLRATVAGYRAAIVFVVQREDASRFRPFEAADPPFAAALRAAAHAVGVLAFGCSVTRDQVRISHRVAVEL